MPYSVCLRGEKELLYMGFERSNTLAVQWTLIREIVILLQNTHINNNNNNYIFITRTHLPKDTRGAQLYNSISY